MKYPDSVYKRVKAIIKSCRTREQLQNAERYMNQYLGHFGKDEHYEELNAVLKKKDLELFPIEPEHAI